MSDEPETSGATSGSAPTSTRRCTVDGPPSGAGALGVGSVVSLGCGPGGSAASTARWSGFDRFADFEEPGSVEPAPATGGVAGGIGEVITVDAIGAESETSGATSSGSVSLST
jgi:hypothetical protein